MAGKMSYSFRKFLCKAFYRLNQMFRFVIGLNNFNIKRYDLFKKIVTLTNARSPN